MTLDTTTLADERHAHANTCLRIAEISCTLRTKIISLTSRIRTGELPHWYVCSLAYPAVGKCPAIAPFPFSLRHYRIGLSTPLDI